MARNSSVEILNFSENATEVQPESEHYSLGFHDYIILVYGLIALIPNSCLLYVIIKNKLQKRVSYLYVAAYAMSNILTGFAFICSAIRRFVISTAPLYTLHPLQCMSQAFYVSIYQGCDILGVAIPALISFDRFVAVTSHRIYSRMNLKTAWGFIGLVGIIIAIDVVGCWVSAALIPEDVLIVATCVDVTYVMETFSYAHRILLTILSYASLGFYVGALLAILCRPSTGNSVRAAQLKREAVITKRLSYLIILTFFVQTMPLTIDFIELSDDVANVVVIVTFLADYLNMATFVLIFSAINPELRKGFLQLCCKKSAAVASETTRR
ncbi:hypothetical protein T4B_18 [Trichinella pseudospiralis]|uniref:G-protein coupled receptors family 1 profile domain-containing protein n=2 Tax=Trichinella pseudospiralis TaxID=6337 RepID=A0A0V1ILG4_TRIPS|nr:hypothetical protein T4E_7793 [Trichinella pseudospiralis]KRY74463.1 hypothetical protein T4A_13835 [Trichinella pseudospiralis]KRY82852.1 hypothetical protein T4D_8787 [Trichinella pseudospiralis]KRZ23614.1 hypothetical protein T4B_18 [Trichinella pseudospiralis]KRZ34634.1 hypothetical protein T4C_12178 [Trichinella pseudospiralis]